MTEPDNSLLRTYLNSLPPDERVAFATRCGTTVGYIRKALSAGERFGEKLVISFDRESRGQVPCERLRPDVDWEYVRGKRRSPSDFTISNVS